MTDVPHPADAALGADWRPPGQRRLEAEAAWRQHDQRDRLDELAAERDDEGRTTWYQARVEDAADGWVEVWLRPVGPLDPRPPIGIGGWPSKDEADEIVSMSIELIPHLLGSNRRPSGAARRVRQLARRRLAARPERRRFLQIK